MAVEILRARAAHSAFIMATSPSIGSQPCFHTLLEKVERTSYGRQTSTPPTASTSSWMLSKLAIIAPSSGTPVSWCTVVAASLAPSMEAPAEANGRSDAQETDRTCQSETLPLRAIGGGAQYPEGKKMARPYFAIAINGRLQRKDKDGKKAEVRMNNIVNPSNTVIFLEQGLPGEPKAHETISKNAYDGAPKGNAKSFVARYTGKGLIAFVGGNVREVSGKELLTDTGDIIWSAEQATTDQSAIVWTTDPKDDPN